MTGWLITHDNCLDGATAALVGLASGLQPIFVQPDRVANGLEQIIDGRPVYLADVSLKLDSWETWRDRITYVLDHHQSALSLKDYPNVLIDQSRSGAHLMYDYATHQEWIQASPAWDRLCLAVERYDLWKPRHEYGQNLNRLFHSQGFSWYADRFRQGFTPFTASEGQLLAQLIDDERHFVQNHLNSAIRHQGALPFPIYGIRLQDEGSINMISHTLLGQGAGLILVIKPDKRLSCRTDARVDAAKLMEHLYHGGGHPRAAGGRLADDQSDDLLALLRQVADFLANS